MLSGKTILVSGGTGYLGEEICQTCSRYGGTVIFTYHQSAERAQQMMEKNPQLKGVQLNLADVRGLITAIDQLYREVPQIDVLVNNAAISHIMPLAMLEEEDVDRVFDINLKGMLFLTRAVARGMIRNQSGTIVSLGSIAGERMLAVPVTYAMTKSAVNGFTMALAKELQKFNIRVNAVTPGLLDGGVAQGVPEDLREEFIRHCAAGRAGNAGEVAELVAFLGSDKASYINGQNIQINGGF